MLYFDFFTFFAFDDDMFREIRVLFRSVLTLSFPFCWKSDHYLMSEKRMDAGKVQDFLYRDCGLKGLSGVSNDMRELLESRDPRASFAIDYFAYRVGLSAGMLAAALQGIDAFVFTAGIGENSNAIRACVAEKLAWLGVSLDPTENAKHALKISQRGSRVPVYVIPTDEERMIAEHTLSVLWATNSNAKREIAS